MGIMLEHHTLKLLSLFIFSLILPACSVNPVTGDSDFVIMSEQEEKNMGDVEHPKILKKYGIYSTKKLQRYVNRIGQKLAANSHRNRLDYTFTVLDSSMVNAFALPGGYIYITRGMMAYLNSEAQLAAVLGHEIGHVTARHGVRQYSAAKATQVGGMIGSIFLPAGVSSAALSLADVLGSAMLKGYGRDHELQSDGLAAEYLASSGYNPESMIEVLSVLKAQEQYDKQVAKEQGREPNSYHGVFASHPKNDQRLQAVVRKTNTMKKYQQSKSILDEHKVDPYLLQINGLVYGDSEHNGRIHKGRLYHSTLGMSIGIPEAWETQGSKNQLVLISPKRDALLAVWHVKSIQNKSLQQQVRDFFELKDIKLQSKTFKTKSGIKMLTLQAKTETPFGKNNNLLGIVEFDKQRYIFVGAAENKVGLNKYLTTFNKTMKSFRKLKFNEQQYAKPLRIKVVKNSNLNNIIVLVKDTPIKDHKEEQLRLLNGVYPQGDLNTLHEIKIIH